ncbi:NAD-dependent epimerase/dehydratase family protein [Nocardioides humilatus]|uniref:NAD-dependent epimerase/dehydratase family protein n=1 Tax=Nocardioides humilatus TaxID=2607660 RepID=A0A5B1L617_9ACTN|nr:NAD-dependent epimerase/dehydratase family protein [Nocardioides humilatus]KAA1415955.1 NAD-dependent epimerase/dehydratase family protein [Nocardioides humilatus]
MTPVLVTGGGGYVACHLVRQLLERNIPVHTTVRDLTNRAKMQPLAAMKLEFPGLLRLFDADLMVPGSFAKAMAGCEVVHHVASPFLMPERITDGQRQVVDPAVAGTSNILDTVEETPSVTRVVLTSTVGAIFGDYVDVLAMKDQVLSEAYFNTTSTVENNPYHYAKVKAERLAWRYAEAQDRWRLVTINPGLILGPSLTPASDSGSLFLLNELLRGDFFYGAPAFSFTTVDVRDVALAHIRAAELSHAHGRYILAQRTMTSMLEIARLVRPVHHRKRALPRWRIPDVAVRIIGPRFGLTPDYIAKHLGIEFTVDNRRSVDELQIQYRTTAETLIDHYRSWAAQQ